MPARSTTFCTRGLVAQRLKADMDTHSSREDSSALTAQVGCDFFSGASLLFTNRVALGQHAKDTACGIRRLSNSCIRWLTPPARARVESSLSDSVSLFPFRVARLV